MITEQTILEVKNLETGYGDNQVIKDVSLEVNNGESVTIIGPNGAGKSTVLKAILGYIRCWNGSVTYLEEDITDTSTHELIKKGVSYVPQGDTVFPKMTVKEHLEMGAWTVDDDGQVEERIDEIFDIFPKLKGRLNQRVSTMSGGEQQMVSIARALMIDPDLLILDEPSLGLAPILVDEVFEIISHVNDTGVGVLMVEQNAGTSLRETHRGYVIDQGVVKKSGDSDELLNDESVHKLYLGGQSGNSR